MLDAVTVEIMWTRLVSIVDEAAKVIARTAFSTLSNDANDYACVLTDAEGASLAQNTSGIPSFIATLPATVRHLLTAFGAADMRDGDVYMTNDPWMGTGHLPDVCLIKPLFHGGRLGGFRGQHVARAGYRRASPLDRAAGHLRGGAAHPAGAVPARRANPMRCW